MPTPFRVLHHDRCFDGACSAALFTRFHRTCIEPTATYQYRGLAHTPGGRFDSTVFGPGENGIVDFKFSPDPRLSWWFDHHQSAFLSPADRAAFEAKDPRRFFFDPLAISCTGFIARTAQARFGFDPTGLEDLLHWADIIDGARYESAAAAVEMKAPAMKLTLVIENAPDDSFIPQIIPLLTEMPLQQVLDQPFIQAAVAPLWQIHQQNIELIRQRAELQDGVIFFDLSDHNIEGLSKFIPYFFYPEATYTIGLTRSSSRTKISVGTNPWTTLPADQLVNLAEICERFGGGGHARVGAISFAADQVELAREVALGIAGDLRQHTGQR